MIEVLEKIEGLGKKPILTDKLHALFAGVSGFHEIVYQSETFEREVTKRHQGLTNVITGEFLLLDNQHVMPFFGKQSPGRGTGRTASYDDSVIVRFFGNHSIKQTFEFNST